MFTFTSGILLSLTVSFPPGEAMPEAHLLTPKHFPLLVEGLGVVQLSGKREVVDGTRLDFDGSSRASPRKRRPDARLGVPLLDGRRASPG